MEKQRGSNWSRWDLHIHSTASDGKATPEEIVDQAIEQGLSVIALTDHHTLDNVDRAKEIGKAKGITVIAGVEFRTEYGQRSVHMIGLFPDEHDGMKLTGKAIEENVLNPLGLSRTTIVAEARADDSSLKDDAAAYKAGLLQHQVDFKKAADYIHAYGGLVTVHAGSKSNSLDEEMRHEGTGPKNVELKDSLGPVKDDLLRNYIDICEVRNRKETTFYNDKYSLPCIAASDAHNKNEIARNFAWIKADTTFEGLRQIKYEPTARVRIQVAPPEEKRSYHVIDKVILDHNNFGKQEILFNEGLNVIIGGRSSGKSLLLGTIAKLADGTITVKKGKPDYDQFVESIALHSKLVWKDCSENNSHCIDYFAQGHIIEIAADPKLRARLIEGLFRAEDARGQLIQRYRSNVNALSGDIHKEFSTFISEYNAREQLKSELTKIGSRDGIELEIVRLSESAKEITETMPQKLTAEQETKYKEQCNALDSIQKETKKNSKTVAQLRNGDIIDFFTNLELFPTIGDPDILERVNKEFSEVLCSAQHEWNTRIHTIIDELESASSKASEDAKAIESDPGYIFSKSYYNQNVELAAILDKLEEERRKLAQLETTEEEIKRRTEAMHASFAKLLEMHANFYDEAKACCDGIIIEKDGVRVSAHVVFNKDRYNQMIDTYFDRRVANNASIAQLDFADRESYVRRINAILKNLSYNQYGLRRKVDKIYVAQEFLASNWFDLQYDIHYQGDNLRQMSEGKSAYVILRLLLDFSDNEYPILIDQPEDELDNRAIFTELVSYIREKKNKRQIILVTHNPNIVVGGDAEEVIVANHNGSGNENHNDVKFEYWSGPLEDSFQDDASRYILTQKGIREHVCEILEGGTEAFKKRERRYRI